MSQQEPITTVIIEPSPPTVNFLNYTSEFTSILKSLKSASKEAINVLEKIMKESDDDKLKLQAASKLMEFLIQAGREVEGAQLQRLIAQARMGQQSNSKQLVNSDEQSKPARPVINFNEIREV